MNLWKRSAAMIIFIGGMASGFAQQMPPIPTDPNVRIGKLENGLTYYMYDKLSGKPAERVS